MRFAFILGHVPVLSSIEAKRVISDLEIERVAGNVLIGVCSLSDPRGVMNRMGGMVKIARFEKRAALERLEEESASLLASRASGGKITFGVSWFGGLRSSHRFAMRVKHRLKEMGRSVRYVRGKGAVLNSAELAFNGLGRPGRIELCLIPAEDSKEIELFVMEAFQDVGWFVELERALGARDDRRGVVPLRLAKILVNLSGVTPMSRFLDPFCGSGMLVSVAAVMGVKKIIASDSSMRAVEDTRRNLENITVGGGAARRFVAECQYRVEPWDVRTLSRRLPSASINTIVTEPYLGPHTRVANEYEMERLGALYHAAFKEFRKVLAPGGSVLFLFPVMNDLHDFDEVQKAIRGMGLRKVDLMEGLREWFPHETEPVYARPRQRVKRLITLWRRV